MTINVFAMKTKDISAEMMNVYIYAEKMKYMLTMNAKQLVLMMRYFIMENAKMNVYTVVLILKSSAIKMENIIKRIVVIAYPNALILEIGVMNTTKSIVMMKEIVEKVM